MINIICNRLEYSFTHEIHSATPDEIRLKPGLYFRELSSNKIEYSKSNKESDAGTVITETVKLKIGYNTLLTELTNAKLILTLHTSENQRIIVGSLQYPVTYSYQTKSPETEITFTVKH